MWWRLKRSLYVKQKGSGNKNNFKKIVNSGNVPGILAYSKGKPIGWCSVDKRESFPVLERSRILKKIDDKPVWSIVCFFVKKEFRRKDVTVDLLKATIKYVGKCGGKILEGYPIDPKNGKYPDTFAFIGLASAYEKAGFKEVIRRSSTRLIMRYLI